MKELNLQPTEQKKIIESEYFTVIKLDCLLLALEASLENNNKGDNE